MPLQSKRTVKIHEIPAGTTKEQYLDFVEHLCTKSQKTSKFHFSRVTKHFKGKSKSNASALSVPTDEVAEEPKSKDEAEPVQSSSTSRGEGGQAEPLLDNSRPAKGWIGFTFFLQNDFPVGTISFENELLKKEALERHEKDKKFCWKDWTVEDNFKGVTILHDMPDAKVDICAVHGLGGNAIDTWTAKSGKMWLKDFLPEHENFESSRIMVFGYDLDLTDRSTVMELENWAETLLQSLNEVRSGGKEKTRPLLLVSHSLGGLVVRKAMARLHLTSNFKNITLSQCGIVFLATPHSGSTKADWSNFLVATAHAIGGVRPETVKTLQSFNTASVWDTAAYLNLEPCPPFRCFAEGQKMRVKGTNQHIVTQASATLGKHQAHMIMGVDHSSICKFNSRLGAFVTITMALRDLLHEVTTGGVQQPKAQQDRRMFGQPRFQAHAYPPDRGFWWEGNELNEIQHQITSARPFFGRSKELETLETSLATNTTRPKLTVIKGIPGIGKTEFLLQFAARQRGRRNVFFLGSHEDETVDSVLSKLSTRIGFEMIDNLAENQERWRITPVSERIQIFMTWLGQACNKESLFIVDDIEAFGYSKILDILKYPAYHTLVSTRDSNLIRSDRNFREFRLPPLRHVDTMKILESTLEGLSSNPVYRNGLDLVARRVQGHPLAARNAMPFIMEHLATYDSPSIEFSHLFHSDDPEERKTFLDFIFEGRSLWSAFNTSLERLELQENHKSAASLLQVLPLLCFHNECVDDFLKMDKRWLRESEDDLPDLAILKSGYTLVSSWLSKLRGVSFYVHSDSLGPTRSFDIHPLMSQYMLLQIDEGRRISLLRQVLHLFYKLEDRGATRESQIKPHVQHCIGVCHGLGLSLSNLDLPEGVMKWAEEFLEKQEIQELVDVGDLGEDPFADPVELPYKSVDDFVTLCVETREKLQGIGNTMTEASAAYKMIADCKKAFQKAQRHIGVPEELPDSRKPILVDAMTMFQDMVRLRSIYPEIIWDLEDYKKRLQGDQ